MVPLATDEIVWLKADAGDTIIYTANKTFSVGTNLKDFAAKLNPAKFLRVHRSAVINLDCINRIEEDACHLISYMSNGNEVPASQPAAPVRKSSKNFSLESHFIAVRLPIKPPFHRLLAPKLNFNS